jgi:hypothetical protein
VVVYSLTLVLEGGLKTVPRPEFNTECPNSSYEAYRVQPLECHDDVGIVSDDGNKVDVPASDVRKC